MSLFYPVSGFHFAVVFELFPQTDSDLRFREVSGLSQELSTEDLVEGGENRFSHTLPVRTSYGTISLKRGFFVGSGLIKWVKEAIENFDFKPTNLTITLLNQLHAPVAAWYVVNAYPVKWEISSFNAEENSVVTETIDIKYQYYKSMQI